MREVSEVFRRFNLTAVLLILLIAALPVRPVSASGTSLTVSPPTSDLEPGEHIHLQVVLNTEAPSRGLQFGMTFDPAVIQIDDVSVGSFYADWASSVGAGTTSIPFVPDNTSGRISIGGVAVLGGQPDAGATGSGVVLNLEATARGGGTGQSLLRFNDVVVSSAQARDLPEVAATGAVLQVGPSAAARAPAQQTFGPTPGPTSGSLAMAAMPSASDAQSATSTPAVAWPLVAALAIGVGLATYALIMGVSRLLALRPKRSRS
jgi:hypothetical protein